MTSSKDLRFEPYARLLTMLGDQLIKNERIALVEIIKNSYDADASWVKVIFADFGAGFEVRSDSKIIVEDDGEGMTQRVLEEDWVKPATPIKKISKSENDTTKKGRKIQGEKGIGRFAILKLGKNLSITTRPKDCPGEFVLRLNLSGYDDEFLTENSETKKLVGLLLKDIPVSLEINNSASSIRSMSINLGRRKIRRVAHGTRIEVSGLRGTWDEEKVRGVYEDIVRLQSIFDEKDAEDSTERSTDLDFEVLIYKDADYRDFSDQYLSKLRELNRNHSVLRIENGVYNEKTKEFVFKLNGKTRHLSLTDPDISGLQVFRDRFGKEGELLAKRGTMCGSFEFGFYVFDFGKDASGKYTLDGEDRKLIKDHRIYLYRDGIRIYPYGDPNDDWLQIDKFRGTRSAGQFLSNDQVVGFVNITQAGNPNLRDKTSREGLIDIGDATGDFISLLQIFLRWVRYKPYDQYRMKHAKKKDIEVFKKEQVREALETLEQKLSGNKPALEALATAAHLYKTERSYLIQRAETTEHLAGVGLSVETASHDITAVMRRALTTLDGLIRESSGKGDLSKDLVHHELSALRGMLSFVESQLKNLELLFKSTKQRRRDIRVSEVLEKVKRLFSSEFRKTAIDAKVVERGSPLIAKTTDAVLLQLFLNLFDNAVYWLQSKTNGKRTIEIILNGDEGTLVFADNGPGVRPDDAAFIFEPFYSGRGEEGRGLGLYIARQLLDRHEYSIELADLKRHRVLPGANFVVSFAKGAD
jgi:signal transduction histidine kinase